MKVPFLRDVNLDDGSNVGRKKSEEGWLLWQYANLAKCKR